ncbi:hypothetical protein [Novosphingobium sp.]|uniref:hypothetical protein n=1 Tax=Novosphingobium sp. TaxID=1874826 RepID=UPI002FDED46D
MTGRHPAPIYLECYLDRSVLPSRKILDEAVQVKLEDGLWLCRLHAPNGARTTVTVPGSPQPLGYQHFAKILRNATDGGDLWMTPWSASPSRPLEEVTVGAWSGDTMLSKQEWSLQSHRRADRRWLMASSRRKEARIDFLQIVTTGGVSMFVRCPPMDDIEFRCERTDSIYPVRPVFSTADADVSAYWGFTRHAIAKGAFSLGEKMARASIKRPISMAQAVVAAHWVTSFGVDDAGYLEPLAEQLANQPDSTDALIMKWVLDLGSAPPEKREEVRQRFWFVAETALRKLPTFTGAVRLLCERLPADPDRLEAGIQRGPGARRLLERLWRLASAMAWDTEHTSFRGLRPDEPDPTAEAAHIDEGSKKKFAGRKFSS